MSHNIQTNTTERLTPCLQKKIDKTTYLIEVHFSDTSTQSVEDKLRRVILHDLVHGKQGKSRKMMNTSLTSSNRCCHFINYPLVFIFAVFQITVWRTACNVFSTLAFCLKSRLDFLADVLCIVFIDHIIWAFPYFPPECGSVSVCSSAYDPMRSGCPLPAPEYRFHGWQADVS